MTYTCLPVSHCFLDTGSLSNLLVLTYTQAKATVPHYYKHDSLLESRNSKLQSFINSLHAGGHFSGPIIES